MATTACSASHKASSCRANNPFACFLFAVVCVVQFIMAGAKESHHDVHTELHDAGYHHRICCRCGSAGQLASVTGDISTYATSHCGQDIDGCCGSNFAETCSDPQLVPAPERVRFCELPSL